MKKVICICLLITMISCGFIQLSYAVRVYFKDFEWPKNLPEWVQVMLQETDADWLISITKTTLPCSTAKSMNISGHIFTWTFGWIALMPVWYWWSQAGTVADIYEVAIINLNTGETEKFKKYTAYHKDIPLGNWMYKRRKSLSEFFTLDILKEIFIKKDINKPTLKVLPPLNVKSITTSAELANLEYIATDDVEIERVRIWLNDRKVYDKYFSYQLEVMDTVPLWLEYGENKIKIVVYDWVGREAKYETLVIRKKEEISMAYEKLGGGELSKIVPPELSFNVSIEDENNNNCFDGGEKVAIKVSVSNSGKGIAKSVKVRLHGDEDFIKFVGPMRELGDLGPGSTGEVKFETTLPTELPRKELQIFISVHEARGFSPAKSVEKRIAMLPKEFEVEVALPRLEPVPNTYKDAKTSAYGIVIGISDYLSVDKLRFSVKDAEVMMKYITFTMGIPKVNIKTLYNSEATKSKIEAIVKSWLKQKKPEKVIFYYSGHGTPDPADPRNEKAYLIPYDGDIDLGVTTMVPLDELIQSIEETGAKEIIVILDACFSGRGGKTPKLLAQKGIAISPKIQSSKSVIFSSSKGTQPSLEFEKAGHGYFTYYLCLGLKGEADKNKNGWVELSEVYEYVKNKMWQELGEKQTPTIVGPQGWENIKLSKTK